MYFLKKIKESNFNVFFIGALFTLFISLVTYRTFVPIQVQQEEVFDYSVKTQEVILENNKIACVINLKGAFLERIFFKEYKHYALNNNGQNNCFEAVWMSKEGKTFLPDRDTIWKIKTVNKDKNDKIFCVILKTEIDGMLFTRKIIMEEDCISLEDSMENISRRQSIDYKDLISFGGFSCEKQGQKDLKFLSYLNNKNKVLKIINSNIQRDSKHKITDHDGIFAIENKLFFIVCEDKNKQGNIFLQSSTQDVKISQIFFLSMGITSKHYKIYLLPKKSEILDKYGFGNLIDYSGILFFLNYFLYKTLSFFLESTKSGIISLLLMILVVILLNLIPIFLLEKERHKITINSGEKKQLENMYSGKDLHNQMMLFYKKHNISIFKMIIFPMIMTMTWFALNNAISLSFDLRKQPFLWLHDLSVGDSYSILNLYGLLNFDIKIIPLHNYFASDVMSFVAATLMISHANKLTTDQNMSNTNNTLGSGNILKIIHYITFIIMCNRLSSGFLLSFIFINIGNRLISSLLQRFIFKS